ncbi:MMPL family transporter [candidate division KSB1 bacterium]|nr:MMPL family transporter [candidate division KSB1 bacterium]
MKNFGLSNRAIDNKTTVFIFTILITIFGIMQYLTTPKEKFPEITFPYFMITTIHPGTSPVDVENLISRPIEKELKGINGIKHINSQSLQDVSLIVVEFEVNVNETKAYLDVKKAMDDSRTELPTDLYQEPELKQIDVSEIPILYVNLSGDLGLVKLKKYADDLKDRIEALEEISKVEIIGALEREIQINVDLFKMQVNSISFSTIENAVAAENLTVSGGQIQTDGMNRNFRVTGEFKDPNKIGNILLKEGVYLKDFARVLDDFEERESYARMDGQQVVSLSVIKKSGKNLILAVDKIKSEISDFKGQSSPGLKIKITSDSSTQTRNSVNDLFNTIILGFIVVVFVLMFFMGELDAFFVGIAIPLSMIIAFSLLPIIGFTLNIIVLMAFILVLGIVVDNSIVVVENIYRHYTQNRDISIVKATKRAVGEVAVPVFTGTLTTLAPFIPLMFMPGIMGKFISYLPITLIITLTSSIIVAYFINPVFAVSFMKRQSDQKENSHTRLPAKFWKIAALGIFFTVLFYILGWMLPANLIIIGLLVYVLLKTIILKMINFFQERILPVLMSAYRKTLKVLLQGQRPYWVVGGTAFLLFFSIFLLRVATPKIVFMPTGDPNYIYVYITMPEGTDLDVTNSVALDVERRINDILGPNNPDVESVITNVAVNAGSGIFDRTTQEKLAKVTVSFVEYKYRRSEKSTLEYLNEIRQKLQDIPAADVNVERDIMGPPPGKPINIEISGPDIDQLVQLSAELEFFIADLQIPGITDLQQNMETHKPEMILHIDRDKASKYGLSTAYIGSTLRTAIYGKEVSTFRDGEDEYPIRLRLAQSYRNNVQVLLSQKLPVPSGNGNGVNQIPISAVANADYTSTYGSIRRIDNNRVITLSSNVQTGYNANEIIASIRDALNTFDLPDGYSVRFSGEQEMQNEIGNYLVKALFIAVALILIILVAQFNSLAKPLIIVVQILFSFIGVLLGFTIFQLDFSVMMTGMGIIAVAGIVVKNAIILIDYIDAAMEQGEDKITGIINAGATRLTPVLLTALSTILGLMPLAIGVNINFITLFTRLNPQIYFGGDNVAFWNPLAWTIIFGLGFATFLTLIVVPAMYRIFYVRNR